GKQILNQLLQQLAVSMVSDISKIEIQGHTDDVPIAENNKSYKTNWELGMDRANSVLEYALQETELNAGLFKISSLSKYQPRYSNTTSSNRRRNRRVEIFIQYKKIETLNS